MGSQGSAISYLRVRRLMSPVRGFLPRRFAFFPKTDSWNSWRSRTSALLASVFHSARVRSLLRLQSPGSSAKLARASRWRNLRELPETNGCSNRRTSSKCASGSFRPSAINCWRFPYPGCRPASDIVILLKAVSGLLGSVFCPSPGSSSSTSGRIEAVEVSPATACGSL